MSINPLFIGGDIIDLECVEQNTGKENLDRVVEQYIIDDDECENESVKEYTVEKVLEHRFKKGKLQYLLKWKGWSSEYNTWENHTNVFADKLIKEYWKKVDLERRSRKSPSLEIEIEIKNDFNESLQSKKINNYCDANGNDKSPHFLDSSSSTKSRYQKRINCDILNVDDSSDENTISSPARNITAENIYPNKRDQSEQETSTTSKLTARPSSSTVAQSSQTQLYPPPIFLQRIKPSLMKELLDPEIRDPKESLNWDEDSIDIEFLELNDQGIIVGYLNWKSGSRSRHLLEELHAKCPQKMLEFYKKNIRFELENENKGYKALQKFNSTRRTMTRW
ncbi:unnamed protein product [Rhizophagus irregularis]|nr:unnamed protein product [Rhizophagus irregularis]CAB5382988.1 unnamed protein product [Rhizophagus irregularis]